MKNNKNEVKIWGNLLIYLPFMFSYTRAKRYDKKHRDLLNQNIVVSFYDNNEKQFYTKNDVRNFFEDNINDVTASIQNNLSESLPEGFRI